MAEFWTGFSLFATAHPILTFVLILAVFITICTAIER